MKRLDAYRVYLLMRLAGRFGSALAFTMFLVYQVTVVGMTPMQLVLAGTMLEVVAFVFEMPTGIVADVVSRRLSIIIGYVLLGGGLFLTGAVPVFGVLMLAQAIMAVGFTFLSGASEAWIVDEIGEENAVHAFLRGSQVSQVGGIIGILVAAPLAAGYLGLPLMVGGGVLVLLAALLLFIMPEDGFKPAARQGGSRWADLTRTARSGLRLIGVRPVLLILVGVSLFSGLFSEGYDRLWAAHLLEQTALPAISLPLIGPIDGVAWFSVIAVVGSLLDVGITELVRRRFDLLNQRTAALLLSGLHLAIIGGLLAFALGRSFAVLVAAMWLVDAARGVAAPVYTAWLNQHVTTEVRATVISMTGQANAIGQIAGGPFVGWIGTIRTLRAALVTSALILAPSVPLILTTLRGRGAAIGALAAEKAAAD